jgi:hypothetical protein
MSPGAWQTAQASTLPTAALRATLIKPPFKAAWALAAAPSWQLMQEAVNGVVTTSVAFIVASEALAIAVVAVPPAMPAAYVALMASYLEGSEFSGTVL